MAAAIHVTDNSFEADVLNSGIPVLLDFGASWCGPCRVVDRIVDELALEFDGQAKFCKIDFDNNQETAIKYGIRSMPTLLIFKEGKVVDNIVGALPKNQLTNKLKMQI